MSAVSLAGPAIGGKATVRPAGQAPITNPTSHPHEVKPSRSGERVSAPDSRPTMRVECAWCGVLLRYVRCVPEMAGCCSHGACSACARAFREGVL